MNTSAPSRAASPTGLNSTLPIQLTRLIGREREVVTVLGLLETTRLLTLTGAGGSGKTRLALEAVGRIVEAGTTRVLWIELAPLQDAKVIPQQIAIALDVREEGGRPLTQTLIDALGYRPLLLVLDNCEHLVEACAELADTFLRGCPELQILATSREALGVAGEKAWLVPALSLPPSDAGSADALVHSEAVELFVDRAQDVVPEFRLTDDKAAAVAGICRRLDGVPLAIELAAARVGVLAPDQILERLDNVFALLTRGQRTAVPRHRTLRATIEWSYALLGEPEQRLLQRLSVFTGGFTLDAVEAVCADRELAEQDILQVLGTLIDKSLVLMEERGGTARYRMLETIRQFADGHLRARADEHERLRERHAAFFLSLAMHAAPHLMRAEPRWMERMEADLDNFRAALAWSHATGRDERLGLPLCASLVWFWYHRILWIEGRHWIEGALRTASGTPPVRGAVLQAAGIFAFFVGDVAPAAAWTAESVRIWRMLDDDRHLSFALGAEVQVRLALGDLVAATACAEEAVRLAERAGDRWDVAFATGNSLAAVLVWRGEWREADDALIQAERVFRESGYSFGLAYVLHLRAYAALRLSEPGRAIALAQATLRELEIRRDHFVAARALCTQAYARLMLGDALESVRLLGAGSGLLEAIASRLLPHEQAEFDASVAALRDIVPPEDFAHAWQEGAAMSFGSALRYSLASTVEPRSGSTIEQQDAARPLPPGTPPVPRTGDAEDADPRRATTVPGAALRVHALGPVELFRDAEPLRSDVWSHARPRELLFYLLCHPQGRTREQIGLVFWPDASAAQVKNSFHVLLHKLRKALGTADFVVLDGERYRINPELDVWFDARVFESGVPTLLRASAADAEATKRLAEVLLLYRGDFLEGESVGDWHLEIHNRMCRLYVDGLSVLAERRMAVGDCRGAADALERLLHKENLHEEAHRRLMHCLAQMGERTRALRHYDRLVVLLRDELDAEPEDETVELAKRIRGTAAV